MPIAFITGASSGIGAACAKIFAQNNFNLILNARRLEKVNHIADEISQRYGVKVHVASFDVRDKKAVKEAIDQLPDEWKAIDVLVNNAGLAKGLTKIHEGDTDHWDQMIDTNIKGLLYMSRSVAPLMVANKSGHVINIGSIAGKEVYENGNVYCSTKHAVDALNRSMRNELCEHGIRVSAVNPGAVETEFSVVRFDGDAERAKKVYQGFDNLRAEDIAETVFWVNSRPSHVNINDVIVMPMAQPRAGFVLKK